MKYRLATRRKHQRVRELTEEELEYEAHVSVGDQGHIDWADGLVSAGVEQETETTDDGEAGDV